jgi:TRAP-type C4-dicarboxylate transport system permease small subunit
MKRHRTDALSLAFGAVFLLVAGWWLIGRTIDVGLPTLGWAVALGLIVIGVFGLLGALRGGHREHAGAEAPRWPEEPEDI